VLSAWRDSGLFTTVDQAALNIAEAVTTVAERHLSEDAYDLLREVLTDDQLALLVWAASVINAFNRVSILSQHPLTYRESFGAPVRMRTLDSQAHTGPLIDVSDERELCIHSAEGWWSSPPTTRE
jgi:hypothetical protein